MTIETARATATAAHGTFTVERTYAFDRTTVFGAWATRNAKNEWFGEGDDFLSKTERYELDFRVGGRELLVGLLPSGKHFIYDSIFRDIVDDGRIVAAYDVLIDDRRISVSLMTVEFLDVGGGTKVLLTEQGAFLDGLDTNEDRIEGASDMLDQLGRYLSAHSGGR
jgi:uncharacterized protein YndB with AHSA1/START domain